MSRDPLAAFDEADDPYHDVPPPGDHDYREPFNKRTNGSRPDNGDHDRLEFKRVPDPFVIPAVDWHARSFLVRPTHGEIAGPEKALKSYVLTTVGVGLAAGLDLFGRWSVPVAQRVVTLVGEGGEAGFLRRLGRICAAYGIEPRDILDQLRYTVQTAPVTSTRFRDSITAELDAFQPDIVLLDPWYAYSPSEVDARNLYEAGRALEHVGSLVRDGGASLLISNHFNQTGTGTGLRRITMAGHAEWCDSWILVDHREPANVEQGRFRLKLDIGSRQWGGGAFHLDYDIGRWDDEANEHEGVIRWDVRRAVDDQPAPEEVVAEKVADAKKAIAQAWTRRGRNRTPLTQTDWFSMATGVGNDIKRRAFVEMVDAGRIEEVSLSVVNARGSTRATTRFRLVERGSDVS